jgi:tRNA threonylcarbamoyladenosine biosynthesis protein TsaB
VSFGASKIPFYLRCYLKKISLDLESFDAFVVGSGPGSFTGLRISFSIIKAFSLALEKPVISLGSFFSLAWPFTGEHHRIAAISDARRNFIYTAFFAVNKGVLELQTKEKLLTIEDFAKNHKDYLFITPDECLRHKFTNLYPKANFYPQNIYPRAKYLLQLAEDYYIRKDFTPLDKLEPLYLYPKTCQVK